MASCEEQLCRTSEENERHQDAISPTALVLHVRDVQQLLTGSSSSELLQPPQLKEEAAESLHPQVKEEEDDPLQDHVKEEEEEFDVSQLPLNVFVMKSEEDEDEPPEWSQPHHRSPSGAAPLDELSAPLSHNGDVEDGSDANHQRDDKDSEKKTSKEGFRCPLCGKIFSYECILTRHMRKHTGEKPFGCPVCAKRFTQKVHMESHARTHTGEKPFSCSVCAKTFAQKGTMSRHMTTHTGRTPDDLSAPLSRGDDTEDPLRSHGNCAFRCSVCNDRFHHNVALIAHTATHVGGKPFRCSVCAKSFSRRHHLKEHVWTHREEKRFSCSLCGEGFRYKHNLTPHMRTHTGEKPFACSVCNERFSHKYNMTRHMMTHAKEKPFSCSVCGDKFAHKITLILHTATHMQKGE
ncbi:uncharacterized protein LOC144048997 [Vanacampus margaritifer]